MRHYLYYKIIGQPTASGLVYWYRLSDRPYKTMRGVKVAVDHFFFRNSAKAFELAVITTEANPPMYLLENSTYIGLMNFQRVTVEGY